MDDTGCCHSHCGYPLHRSDSHALRPHPPPPGSFPAHCECHLCFIVPVRPQGHWPYINALMCPPPPNTSPPTPSSPCVPPHHEPPPQSACLNIVPMPPPPAPAHRECHLRLIVPVRPQLTQDDLKETRTAQFLKLFNIPPPPKNKTKCLCLTVSATLAS
jgi:hypothetical protein